MIDKDNLKELYSHIHSLKKLKRQGWLDRGLKGEDCESVADHCFSVAILALALSSEYPQMDQSKLLKIAIIHDLAESIVGDITPQDNISKEDKIKRELEAARKILLPISEELYLLFCEYAKQESPEARLISEIDKLEMSYQAEHYRKKIDTAEFKESAKERIKDLRLRNLL